MGRQSPWGSEARPQARRSVLGAALQPQRLGVTQLDAHRVGAMLGTPTGSHLASLFADQAATAGTQVCH